MAVDATQITDSTEDILFLLAVHANAADCVQQKLTIPMAITSSQALIIFLAHEGWLTAN